MAGKNKGGSPITIDRAKLIEEFKTFVEVEDYPHINAFCLQCFDGEGIARSRLYNLCKEYKELEDTKKKALMKQQLYLEKGGLKGELNSTMSIFILKQPCHGYTDKQTVENIGEQTIYVDIVDEDSEE